MSQQTMDFIDDAIESLDKDGSQYALVIGREGFITTLVYECVADPNDGRAMIMALMDACEEKFPGEDFHKFNTEEEQGEGV